MNKQDVVTSAGIGFLIGLRSMLPVATVTNAIATTPEAFAALLPPPLRTEHIVWLSRFAAAGELIADKTPFIPARTDPMPLLGRIGVALVFVSVLRLYLRQEGWWLHGVIAAVFAVIGAHTGYNVRRGITSQLQLPDAPVAVFEDALVAAGSALVARELKPEASAVAADVL